MNKIATIIISFCLLFMACQKESTENDGNSSFQTGPTVPVSFSIQKQQPVEALDSLPETRSEKMDNDFQIYFTTSETEPETRAITQYANTWLLQFTSDGTCVLCTNLGAVASEGNLTASLSAGTNTTLYLLGNGPATLTRPATLSDFEGNGYFSTDKYANADLLPYIAKVTNVTVSATGKLTTTDGNDVTFRMKRIAARLSLTCTTSLLGYRINSVVLYNAPQKMYYTYTNTVAEVQSVPVTANVVSGNTYTWFIGENLRGTGNSSSQQERYADKAPANSSFIRITLVAPLGCETSTYDIYPGKDLVSNYDLVRNWDYSYTTTITKAGASVSTDKRVKVDNTPIDLTAQPSNCYVVEPGKSYKFRIDTKGETGAVIPAGMIITRANAVASVNVLWQEQKSLVGSLTYVNAQTAIVCFNSDLQGSALVQGINSASGVEWSWHFWVITGGAASLGSYTTNGVAAMDRNLGSLYSSDANPGSVDFRGLIYEWGRKEPFAGAGSTNTDSRRVFYNQSGAVLGPDRYKGPVLINYAIAQPNTFIYSGGGNPNAWLTPVNNDLWGYTSKAKTIFDPCPYGWRVPLDHTVWSDWNSSNFTWNATYLCGRYTNARWFPAAGRYIYNNPPLGSSVVGITEIGTQGYYWTSKPTDDGRAGILHFTNANVVERIDVPHTYGCSIRPVKVP